jgi:alginate O-acetyltransferase complex protein AlgI
VDSIRNGAYLVMWGFFKKLVIADSVGVIVDKIFSVSDPSPTLLAIGTLGFGIQIFADFSGYVDIARGTAKVLGISLSRNFNNPYFSRTPAEFWRRWHITLGTWFRDYLYIPLGGNRGTTFRNSVVLLGTFVVVGLWHGSAWNFILWGAFHGVLILGYRVVSSRIASNFQVPTIVGIVLTFSAVNFGWLLFRAEDLSIVGNSVSAAVHQTGHGSLKESMFLLANIGIYSIPLWMHAVYRNIREHGNHGNAASLISSEMVRVGLAVGLFTGILLLTAESPNDFIYFRF